MNKNRPDHLLFLNATGMTPMLVLLTFASGCQGEGNQRARLESYRALSIGQMTIASAAKSQSGDMPHSGNAQLYASSLNLSREDLLPCESLPPRRLTQSNGVVNWVDGSWSNLARAFIVKGSAQSGLCRLEIRPKGSVVLNPGQKDAFVRGSQIRILLATPNGDALIPQANQGIVHCAERDGAFVISFEGFSLGRSRIGYVMNEGLPLELESRVCLARLLDEERKMLNEWVLILPIQSLASGYVNSPENAR